MPSTTTSRLEGVTTSVAVKAPCRLKTTANHALSGLAAVASVTPAEGDRILVASQTDAAENGIWNASAGAWVRALDFDGSLDVVTGTTVFVHSGTGGGSFWRVSTAGEIIIGTSEIEWSAAPVVFNSSDGWLDLSDFRGGSDTTDEPALEAAPDAIEDAGAKGVRFDTAEVTFKPPLVADEFAGWSNFGSQPVNIRPGTRIDAKGTVISGDPAGGFGEASTLYARLRLLSRHTISAAWTAGAAVIPLAGETAGLSVGDTVLIRAGDIVGDEAETTNWHYSQVESISAGVSVTLKDPVTKAFSAPDLAAATLNKYLWRVTPLTDELDTDFEFAAGTEVGLDVKGMNGGRIRSIAGQCPEGCAIILQYSRNVLIDRIDVRDNIAVGANVGSAGRCAETTVRFLEYSTSNIISSAFACEAGSRVHFDRLSDHNCEGARDVLIAGGESQITFDEMRVTGLGGQTLFNAIDAPASTIRGRRLIIQTSTRPLLTGKLGLNFEELVYDVGGAARETYKIANGYWVERTFDLVNGETTYEPIGAKGTLVALIDVTATAGRAHVELPRKLVAACRTVRSRGRGGQNQAAL